MNNEIMNEIFKKAGKRFTENRYGSSYHDMMVEHVFEAICMDWDKNDPEKESSKELLFQWCKDEAFDTYVFLQIMNQVREKVSEELQIKAVEECPQAIELIKNPSVKVKKIADDCSYSC